MTALGNAYAADQLEVDELERRMALVYRATSRSALSDVLRDIKTGSPVSPGRSPSQPSHLSRNDEYGYAVIARPEAVPERSVVGAVMGGASRKGPWIVPKKLVLYSFMGGMELDMREAQFSEGVTEIESYTVLGGVSIIVPAGIRVETTGVGIMGGFSISTVDADPGPNAPILRLSGLCLMGGLDARGKRFRKRK